MVILSRLLALLVVAVAFVGCSTSRTTTTARTAVEQALISQSAEFTLNKFDEADLAGRTFAFDDSQFEATDKGFASSALKLHVLKSGMREAGKADEAEVAVRPRAAISAIDDSSFLLGIPSLPIVIPGAGSVSIPEVALLGYNKQVGVSRMGMYAIDKADGALLHDYGIQASRAHYVRWRVFFFISFRHTNLEEPYRSAASTGAGVQ
jgi:hypothetical protein